MQVPPTHWYTWHESYRDDLGVWLGIIGIVLNLVGFIIAFYQINRTKKVAQAAKDATELTRKEVVKIDAVIEFSAAITILHEIQRLHRGTAHHVLIERYSNVRDKLVIIATSFAEFNQQQKTNLQNTIQQIRLMQNALEAGLAKKDPTLNTSRLNKIISNEIDFLNELLGEIKLKQEK